MPFSWKRFSAFADVALETRLVLVRFRFHVVDDRLDVEAMEKSVSADDLAAIGTEQHQGRCVTDLPSPLARALAVVFPPEAVPHRTLGPHVELKRRQTRRVVRGVSW